MNLLVIFDALVMEKNTTKAAKRLNLSQPAVSHALARLRDTFSDPLFVRASKGLAPTAKCMELAAPIHEIIEKTESLINAGGRFNPETESREFRILTTDYFELVALPQLLHRLSIEAPHIRLVTRPTTGTLPKDLLEDGDLDLAISGLYGDLPEGYYQQVAFKDDFVCVGRKGNPALKGNLSIKKYAEARHVLISPDGDMKSKSASVLKKQGYEQDFACGTFSFLSPGWIVSQTDLLVTCPRKLAHAYQQYLPVELKGLPVELGPITVVQVWHGRQHRDSAHSWMRNLIKDVCSKSM